MTQSDSLIRATDRELPSSLVAVSRASVTASAANKKASENGVACRE